MSKFVKDLLAKDIARRVEEVSNCLLVDIIGMEANDTVELRRGLREKNINLLVVKNSLARRACEGTELAGAFDGTTGSCAIVWGAEDFVSLAKEITKLNDSKDLKHFTTKGGSMDGESLSAERVKEISKWPNRAEQLSILSGQLLAAGSNLSGALLGPGGALASQIDQKSKEEGSE